MRMNEVFKAIGTGRASVVTDRIQTFTESGILLESGRRLEAEEASWARLSGAVNQVLLAGGRS